MGESRFVQVTDLTKRFGGVVAVERCSVTLERGKIYGLIGPNGSGKTTLFNLMTGLLHPDAGTILFEGRRIEGLPPHQIARRGIGRTFQITRIFPQLTVLENLLAVSLRGWGGEVHARARELLELVGLTSLQEEYAGALSFGQQKLTEFARLLMCDPTLILLDEPAAGINRTLLETLLRRIEELRGRGKTFVIIEHDMSVIMTLCEWIFVLDHGEKIAEGSPGVIQAHPRVMEAYFGRRRDLAR